MAESNEGYSSRHSCSHGSSTGIGPQLDCQQNLPHLQQVELGRVNGKEKVQPSAALHHLIEIPQISEHKGFYATAQPIPSRVLHTLRRGSFLKENYSSSISSPGSSVQWITSSLFAKQPPSHSHKPSSTKLQSTKKRIYAQISKIFFTAPH